MKKERITQILLVVVALLLGINLVISLREPAEVKAERRVEPVLVQVGHTGMEGLTDVQTLGDEALVLRADDRVFVFKIENRTIEGPKRGAY